MGSKKHICNMRGRNIGEGMNDLCWRDSNKLTYDLLFELGLTEAFHKQEGKRRTWEGEGVKTRNKAENKNCNKISCHCSPSRSFQMVSVLSVCCYNRQLASKLRTKR